WQPGDEIILPSLTFVATANAIRYTGATPVFADITSEEDFSISPDAIAAQITPRTRAIIVVHYGGYACDMESVLALAREHGLSVIEDVAHAPGGSLNGRMLGTWGDIGCFSFFSNKNMTTGEGGMITTDDDDLAETLRLLRSHGMTTLTWDRHRGHAASYDVIAPGYNYRIDEMRSAIGRVQLGKLAGNNERRHGVNTLYENIFAEVCPDIGLPYQDHRGISTYHIRPVLLPADADRSRFMEQMKAQGIQTSIHYPPVHTFTEYSRAGQVRSGELTLTETIGRREVTLPLSPFMTEQDVVEVAGAAREALATAKNTPAGVN
ncbi:MAG: DegT/DnrJ/EryC1/StrS family aminotransferase, partial [Chloroflexota bacterium]